MRGEFREARENRLCVENRMCRQEGAHGGDGLSLTVGGAPLSTHRHVKEKERKNLLGELARESTLKKMISSLKRQVNFFFLSL